MLRLILAVACALSLAACNTTRIDAGLASADQKLRDKCAYLVSGVGIAEVASAFLPAAGPLVAQGRALIDAYCGAKPIADLPSAMAAMERIIVAVRPIAAQAK